MTCLSQNVTVENFINILKGDKAAMAGIGSGKVIERYYCSYKIHSSHEILSFACHSGPNSYLFVNLVDHGAPGIFAFPEEYVSEMLYHGVTMTTHGITASCSTVERGD